MKENDQKLLEKYLQGLTNDEENLSVEDMLGSGDNAAEIKRILETEWNSDYNRVSANKEKLDSLLDHIHQLIRQKKSRDRNLVLIKAFNLYAKAAAILLIPLLIAGVFGYMRLSEKDKAPISAIITAEKNEVLKSTIIAPLGSRVSFILPDSTTGMLNSGSKLTYSVPFCNNRNIELEGEAWFDVKHDEVNPFVIGAANSKVVVLGTSFNISAYPTENYIEVVLAKGKVRFSDQDGNAGTNIYPSERLVYQNGNISKTVTDPSKYSSWKEGKLVFRGDQMAEVGRRIERWYNVKVVLADKDLEKYSFRGTFVDDSLDEVLNLLSMTSPISYKRIPRQILNDGTYEKETIIISLRK